MNALEKYIKLIDKELTDIHFPDSPHDLYTSIGYFLNIGGKRVRPILTLIAFELFDSPINQRALDAAMGIELFHNFTLLHDDIMDNAPLRRNSMTVHQKWDTNTAILSGDVMYSLALEKIIVCESLTLSQLFLKTSKEVCEGQQFDMLFETRSNVSIGDYLEMIRLKTSVLIGCALQAGAIIGGADEENQKKMYEIGINIGMAFQLQDDLLDSFGTTKRVGKQIGGDILENKKTYIFLKAWELADDNQKESIKSLLVESDKELKIKGFLELYRQLEIQHISSVLIDEYFCKGMDLLNQIEVGEEQKEVLKNFINHLYNRNC